MNHLISIIIPVYNVAPFLREALDSVVRQTYGNLEILVIDDGSTDDSGSICDEYVSDPRFTVIHQAHQGVSAARNAGLDIASGEFISFLDPDDAFQPSFIQTLFEAMMQEEPDIVVCKYCMLHTVKEMKPKAGQEAFPSSKPGMLDRKEALCALCDGRINVSIWNKLYKRELWKSIRFPIGIDNGEDVMASYDVFDLCHSVCVIDDLLYLHRKHAGSLTTIYTEKSANDRIFSTEYVKKFIKARIPEVFPESYEERVRNTVLHIMITQFVHVKDHEYSKRLQKQIVAKADQVGISNCGFRTRVACRMMRYCPWLLKILYPIYTPIRRFVWRVTGRQARGKEKPWIKRKLS